MRRAIGRSASLYRPASNELKSRTPLSRPSSDSGSRSADRRPSLAPTPDCSNGCDARSRMMANSRLTASAFGYGFGTTSGSPTSDADPLSACSRTCVRSSLWMPTTQVSCGRARRATSDSRSKTSRRSRARAISGSTSDSDSSRSSRSPRDSSVSGWRDRSTSRAARSVERRDLRLGERRARSRACPEQSEVARQRDRHQRGDAHRHVRRVDRTVVFALIGPICLTAEIGVRKPAGRSSTGRMLTCVPH